MGKRINLRNTLCFDLMYLMGDGACCLSTECCDLPRVLLVFSTANSGIQPQSTFHIQASRGSQGTRAVNQTWIRLNYSSLF